ncbi:MAG: hypothetical protein K8L97_26785 [Anaerolineae bacterium]|nr:hypothetical protein [Anaerolineae bacterium]
MGEQKPKREVEWSFSFENISESINQQLRKVGIAMDEEVKTGQFKTPLDDAAEAHIDLILSVGTAKVNALVDSENLLDADLTYTGEIEFETAGTTQKRVKLGQKHAEHSISWPIKDAIGKLVNRTELRWNVGISPKIPLSLDIDGGVGESTLDLTGIQLKRISLNNGVGETRLTLPATGEHYKAEVDVGVGSTRVTLLKDATLDLKIKAGVGSVTIQLPTHAAVRIKVESGIGGVSLPAHFKQTKSGNDFISKSGTWETEGYALSSQQINIRFDGGIGGLKVVEA